MQITKSKSVSLREKNVPYFISDMESNITHTHKNMQVDKQTERWTDDMNPDRAYLGGRWTEKGYWVDMENICELT